jgi:hypothetical protein
VIKNKEVILPLGLVCISLSLLLERLGSGIIPRVAFAEGLFLGLAFAMGVFALVRSAIGADNE